MVFKIALEVNPASARFWHRISPSDVNIKCALAARCNNSRWKDKRQRKGNGGGNGVGEKERITPDLSKAGVIENK